MVWTCFGMVSERNRCTFPNLIGMSKDGLRRLIHELLHSGWLAYVTMERDLTG